MKHLGILTACAVLAMAAPAPSCQLDTPTGAEGVCKERGLGKQRCDAMTDECRVFKDAESINCLKNIDLDCSDGRTCADGFICRAMGPEAIRRCKPETQQDGICKKRELNHRLCQLYQDQCREFHGDPLQCLERLGKACRNGDCGAGMACRRTASVGLGFSSSCQLGQEDEVVQ